MLFKKLLFFLLYNLICVRLLHTTKAGQNIFFSHFGVKKLKKWRTSKKIEAKLNKKFFFWVFTQMLAEIYVQLAAVSDGSRERERKKVRKREREKPRPSFMLSSFTLPSFMLSTSVAWMTACNNAIVHTALPSFAWMTALLSKFAAVPYTTLPSFTSFSTLPYFS